jgi:hypothetical protein
MIANSTTPPISALRVATSRLPAGAIDLVDSKKDNPASRPKLRLDHLLSVQLGVRHDPDFLLVPIRQPDDGFP